LQGDQIPLLARVIAVADTFDALTTTRPYQNAHTPEQALQIVQNLAGKRLDPIVVAALLAVYARGEIKLQRFTIRRPVAAAANASATAPAAPAAPVPAVPLTAPAASIASEAAELERTRV
jgi:HD-GYP domain-containing protein (c-di-GMP phosphodiesterase class II)